MNLITLKNNLFGWLMWLLAALFYALDYFQHTAPSVLIQPIAATLAVDYVHVGSIMSIYFPIYALSQIPAGMLIDRFGLRISLAFACAITSIGLFIMSYPSDMILIIGRALIAFGSAFAFIGTLKTADLWLPKKVFPFAVGITNTLGVLGGILGQPLLQHLIDVYQWQQAIIYVSLFGFILAIAILLLLSTPSTTSPNNTLADNTNNKALFYDKNLYMIAIYAAIMVGTIVNAFSELYDVVFLRENFQISGQQAATISSLLFIGIAVGGPTHGLIVRYLGHAKQWMIIACIAAILSFSSIILLANHTIHLQLLNLAYFSSGFFVSSMLLAFPVAANGYAKQYHAKIFALINMIISLGGFIFQFSLGQFIRLLKNSLPASSHLVFIYSFSGLLIPLLLSLLLCSLIKIRTVE